jgi:septal ring factor EnvC (AmiA/AmiB activator)
MRERLERSESEFRKIEERGEQIEQHLEEIENAIEEIEAAISRLESRGDQEVAAKLQRSLAEKQKEKAQEKRQAQELAKQLDGINTELCDAEEENKLARIEIEMVKQYQGKGTREAENLVGESEKQVKELRGRYRDLRRQLSRLTGGGGWG